MTDVRSPVLTAAQPRAVTAMTPSPALSSVALPRSAVTVLSAKAAHENFPVASRLLPKEERLHLMALYGFARLVDDLGDELPGTPEDRLAALSAAEEELDRAFGGGATHPVFARLSRTIEERSLPRQPFADLIEANRMDQTVTCYESYEDLLGYCRLSANPVGRLVLAVFGQETPERVELSDAICTGLQLVEHWQDIAEDADKGRCYVPQEDLRRFEVPTDSGGLPVLNGRISPALTRLVAFETSRASGHLVSGAPLVRAVKGWARAAVAGYLGGGLAQIDAVRRVGHDVVSRRPKASKATVALRATSVLLRATGGGS